MRSQIYDPLSSIVWSIIATGIPVAVLLCSLAFFHMQARLTTGLALIVGVGIASFVSGIPAAMASKTAGLGIVSGLPPIGWVVPSIIFLYRFTTLNRSSEVLQSPISGITEDRRLQLLLVALSFGVFFEGAAGFGTPVAVMGAILIGLDSSPLAASGLVLIVNTVPVAYGVLGALLIGLAPATGLDPLQPSAMVDRQLPFLSVPVPFWLIWVLAGFHGMLQIWPVILVAGVSLAIPQFLVSNFHGPWLVDVITALVSMGALTLFLEVWRPKTVQTLTILRNREGNSRVDPEIAAEARETATATSGKIAHVQTWLPWVILTVLMLIWGVSQSKAFANGLWAFKFAIPGLDRMVFKGPPMVPKVIAEGAVLNSNALSTAGTDILVSAIVDGLLMSYSPSRMLKEYWDTIELTRYSLPTICTMSGIGYFIRYSGLNATPGLASTRTGVLYPLLGTMLDWLGIVLTDSDTASSVLFGGLQKTTAGQLDLSSILMSAVNSSGDVMGKMIDAQFTVVVSIATKRYGHEGDILQHVLLYSPALAFLMGLMIILQAYVGPFSRMTVH